MSIKSPEWLPNDGRIILLNRGIRSFAFGFISIAIPIYLTELGIESTDVGILLSASILGGAFFTIAAGHYAIGYGMRRMFLLSLFISLTGVSIFLLTENFLLLVLASFIGFISPTGREMGPFLSLEQSYLATEVPSKSRTRAFTSLNIASHLSSTFGALVASLPALLQGYFSMGKLASFRVLFVLYFLLNLVALILYTKISEISFREEKVRLTSETKGIITKLSLLFSLDSFGGGFVIASIISLWFHTKFGIPLTTISSLFFIAGLLESLSYYLSGKLSEKFGLINTMVFTHIPGSLSLILMSFMPSFYPAAFFYLIRQLLSEMDIPARQAYVVSVVNPHERSQTASITNTVRLLSSSVSPTIAGNILLLPLISPFVIGGTLKIVYDLALYVNFKNIKLRE